MYSGLFFENLVHYDSVFPHLLDHIAENEGEISELGKLLYEGVTSFWEGTGRSGSVADRASRNLKYGLEKNSYFAGSGFDPAIMKGDIYAQVSGSGGDKYDKPESQLKSNSWVLRKHLDLAKSVGMVTCGITRDTDSYLAKTADIVIMMPNSISGESYIKDYFNANLSNDRMPFQELGAVFEVSTIELIDGLSYALKRYRGKKHFPVSSINEKIVNSIRYMGSLGHFMEDQKDKIENIIGEIKQSKHNFYTTGFLYNAEIAKMGAIRINHAIHKKNVREAGHIDSNNYPKIKKGDILMPISARGETEFTNSVVKVFSDLGNPIFPLTSNESSAMLSFVDKKNALIFPEGKEYSLSPDYSISDFNMGVVRILDCIALCLGRNEKEMRESHSNFA